MRAITRLSRSSVADVFFFKSAFLALVAFFYLAEGIMVEGIIRNFCVKLFRSWAGGSEVVVFCVFLALMAILFSRAETFGASLVEGIMGNICVKLSQS